MSTTIQVLSPFTLAVALGSVSVAHERFASFSARHDLSVSESEVASICERLNSGDWVREDAAAADALDRLSPGEAEFIACAIEFALEFHLGKLECMPQLEDFIDEDGRLNEVDEAHEFRTGVWVRVS